MQQQNSNSASMDISDILDNHKKIAVIVAHPDDETLWCGGMMLLYPNCDWFVACLCRKNDPDRAPKFGKTLKILNAHGVMGNLDDGPEQKPLHEKLVQDHILRLLLQTRFDLVITHSPFGEYTRHLRHEEIGRAVIALWNDKKIETKQLWCFAYEDGNKKYYPQPISQATSTHTLPNKIWKEKYRIITDVYGFDEDGFEAKTTPKTEAFWTFKTPNEAQKWVAQIKLNKNIL